MTTEEATDKMLNTIFYPVFFQKLAAAGIVPTTEQEAQELLYLAQTLPEARQKQAAAAPSLISLATQGMREHMGHSDTIKQASEEHQLAEAVDIWAEDPELWKAAAVLS